MTHDIFGARRGGFSNSKGNKKSPHDKAMAVTELKDLLRCAGEDLSVHGRNAYALITIAGNFGLRCSEAIDLEQKDFETMRHGYFRVRTLKKKAREVDRAYMGTKCLKYMERLLNERKELHKTKLFPFGDRAARYLFAYYAQTAGISANVSFHALRHTSARMLLSAQKDGPFAHVAMDIVEHFLRHAPTSTRIYTQPSHEDMIEALNRKEFVH